MPRENFFFRVFSFAKRPFLIGCQNIVAFYEAKTHDAMIVLEAKSFWDGLRCSHKTTIKCIQSVVTSVTCCLKGISIMAKMIQVNLINMVREPVSRTVSCLMSHVTRDLSHVTCDLSHVKCHM